MAQSLKNDGACQFGYQKSSVSCLKMGTTSLAGCAGLPTEPLAGSADPLDCGDPVTSLAGIRFSGRPISRTRVRDRRESSFTLLSAGDQVPSREQKTIDPFQE